MFPSNRGDSIYRDSTLHNNIIEPILFNHKQETERDTRVLVVYIFFSLVFESFHIISHSKFSSYSLQQYIIYIACVCVCNYGVIPRAENTGDNRIINWQTVLVKYHIEYFKGQEKNSGYQGLRDSMVLHNKWPTILFNHGEPGRDTRMFFVFIFLSFILESFYTSHSAFASLFFFVYCLQYYNIYFACVQLCRVPRGERVRRQHI